MPTLKTYPFFGVFLISVNSILTMSVTWDQNVQLFLSLSSSQK